MRLPRLRRAKPGPREGKVARLSFTSGERILALETSSPTTLSRHSLFLSLGEARMPLPCLRRATPGPREGKVARLSFASEERNSRDFFLDHPLLFVSGGGYHPLISPRASETSPRDFSPPSSSHCLRTRLARLCFTSEERNVPLETFFSTTLFSHLGRRVARPSFTSEERNVASRLLPPPPSSQHSLVLSLEDARMPLPRLRRAKPGPRERKVARLFFSSEEQNFPWRALPHPCTL